MIFTRTLITPFVDISDISTEQLYKTLNDIGLEVVSCHQLKAPKGVVVGKILEVEKHPNADKLSVCRVDIGGAAPLQIVCGAKNVATNAWVALATEGTKISDTLTIKQSKLRGIQSEGMLCSLSELGFPKVNEGIVILDSSIGALVLGKPLEEYPLFNDDIFEIDITPNRGDCLSFYGVARELAAIYEKNFNECPKKPERENVLGIGRLLQVSCEGKLDSSLLYKTIELKEPSLPLSVALPLAYNELLCDNGLSNFLRYATLLSGVLIRAYPHEGIKDERPIKRTFVIKRDENALECVYEGGQKLSSIGISAHDSSKMHAFVILEASFTPPAILSERVAQSKAKADSYTFYRASRGSNPNLNEGIDLLCNALQKINGATIHSGTHEITQDYKPRMININIDSLNKLIGIKLEKAKAIAILKRLGFKVDLKHDDSAIMVYPPLARHDIQNRQDVAEEIVRMIGIDTIVATPLNIAHKSRKSAELIAYKYRRTLAKRAQAMGFSEAVTFLFNQKSRLVEWGYTPLNEGIDLLNPITSELDTLRPTLLLSLLDVIARNKNLGYTQIALFEIGSVYSITREERAMVAFVASGFKEDAHFPHPKGVRWDILSFASALSSVIGEFSLEQYAPQSRKIFHPAQCAYIIKEGKRIGTLAKLHPLAQERFEIDETFMAEIELDTLAPKLIKAQNFSRFQPLQRDLTVLISQNHPFNAIREAIKKLAIPELKGIFPLDLYSDETFESGKTSLTIRVEIQSESKTLEEEEIAGIMAKILRLLEQEFGAKLR